jgi:hypothetical protein
MFGRIDIIYCRLRSPVVTAGGVRLYLVGNILCIIDCHICWGIFGRVYIMYCRLPYISRGVLQLKTLVLYIYRAERHNAIHPIIICNLFFLQCLLLGVAAFCRGACAVTGDAVGGFTCGTAFQRW